MVRLLILIIFLASLTPIPMLFLSSFIGEEGGFFEKMWGINRYNLWGQVLGYFPRNLCMWPLLTAVVVGGMISDDRQHGTSAIYFSRPISRLDYTFMKYLSVAIILGFVIIFSYFAYYTSAIVFKAEGWAYLADTLPIFLGGMLAGSILVITYTSIGLALSSISQSRFFAAIGFLSIIYGTKLVSLLVELQFGTTFMYAMSPYDCLAHTGQFLLGIPSNYEHPVSISVVSLMAMNSISIWLLVSRVTSLEVTRE
jgi:ABC-type transport system involved in multi-copper enzyme maturation permease subunit